MKSKKLVIILLSLIMVISTLIPTYAVNNVIDDYKIPPSDLGEEIPLNTYNGGYRKYYIRIDLSETRDLNIQFRMFYSEYSTTVQNTIRIIIQNNHISITNTLNYNNNYSYVVIPILNIDYTNELYLYLPVYAYNAIPFTGFTESAIQEGLKYYYSTTNEETVIQREAFQVGYENGYYNGYTDGLIDSADFQSDLNIVEHIEQLLSTFIGDEYATYITPIALVLTILLIYFLFIRWLLSMIKAKGVLKVCDIIVLVACISILVVLYFPMIDITTTQHQIIENVYSVTSDITP